MNKKGYTLVELLATLIVLSIVIGITIPIALNVINNSKEKDLELIKKNISDAAVNLVNECNFDDSFEDGLSKKICDKLSKDELLLVQVQDLIVRGFLTYEEKNGEYDSNHPDDTGYIIKNPVSNKNLAYCYFRLKNDGSVCSTVSNDSQCGLFDGCKE